MIELEHISKIYPGSSVKAVDDVNLSIQKGDVYGIVGFSGAGKSTLVRCINLLERPTSGRVTVGGTLVTAASPAELRRLRRKIGMIFQQFNLFATRTVYENIAFPLRYCGKSKGEIADKVGRLLDYVELSDKRDMYPSQLSGGQKQRVAIARALASDPDVLLCDEATSALDPLTTGSILKLLKRLNTETGITLVIITHQMQVVKEICNRVAVMENGRVVEEGDVYTVFSEPKEAVTKRFLADGSELSEEDIRTLLSTEKAGKADKYGAPEDNAAGNPENTSAGVYCRRVLRLRYRRDSAMESLVSAVSREFNVDINILGGNIELINATPLGRLTISCSGTEEAVRQSISRIKEKNVELEVIDLDRTA